MDYKEFDFNVSEVNIKIAVLWQCLIAIPALLDSISSVPCLEVPENSLDQGTCYPMLGIAAQTWNPNTWKAEAGGLCV